MQSPVYGDRLATRKLASKLGVSPTPSRSRIHPAAQQDAWELANLFAGRPRVRVAHYDGRRKKWQYPAQREQHLTAEVPKAPAAVMLYDAHGMCQTLVADIDVEGNDGARLTHNVVAFLERCGAKVIIDRSPAGKHHVYVPLLDRLSVHEATELVSALARRFPGIDPLPHATGAVSGCIRTPGSPYKDGQGYQELVTDYDTTRRTLMQRNGAHVTAALTRALGNEIAAYRREKMHLAKPVAELEADNPVERLPLGEVVLSSKITMIVREGLYAEAGYSDRSRARMAALTAARRAGLDLKGVITRIEDGRWAGLAAMYQNATTPWRRLLASTEWPKAVALVGRTPKKTRGSQQPHETVQYCNTSKDLKVTRGEPHHTTLDEHRFLRHVRHALHAALPHEFRTREGRTLAYVLRALLAAAHQTGSRYVEFGVRSLSLSLPMDHTGVSRALTTLREQDDPWITLERGGHGTKADLYQLHIPERYRESEDAALEPGKIHALRPAFRVLGVAAAEVFEAVERGHRTPHAIARATGLSRTTVYEHVGIMKAWNLLTDNSDELEAHPERLTSVAEHLGVDVFLAQRHQIIRQQRRRWLNYLTRFTRENDAWWDMTLGRAGPLPRAA